jgi:murein DD-endopeptidase MepM/ murein hydrolase activator NlpD
MMDAVAPARWLALERAKSSQGTPVLRSLRLALVGAALMTALSSSAALAATDYSRFLPVADRPLTTVRNAIGYALPLSGRLRVTTPFGERGPYWKLGYHPGIDFGVPIGTSVQAVADGVVIEAEEDGWHKGYGGYVKVDHGDGLHSLYAHLSRVDVSVGDQVSAGDHLARSGNTGVSTGPHLHLEMRQDGVHKDPAPYLGI